MTDETNGDGTDSVLGELLDTSDSEETIKDFAELELGQETEQEVDNQLDSESYQLLEDAFEKDVGDSKSVGESKVEVEENLVEQAYKTIYEFLNTEQHQKLQSFSKGILGDLQLEDYVGFSQEKKSEIAKKLNTTDSSLEKILKYKRTTSKLLKTEVLRIDHINRLDDVLKKCLSFDRLEDFEIMEAKEFIEDIRGDISGTSSDYGVLFKDINPDQVPRVYHALLSSLSERGVNDFYHLASFFYYATNKKEFHFTKQDMETLLDQMETYIDSSEKIQKTGFSAVESVKSMIDKFYLPAKEDEEVSMTLDDAKLRKKGNNEDSAELLTGINNLARVTLATKGIANQFVVKYRLMLKYLGEREKRFDETRNKMYANYKNLSESRKNMLEDITGITIDEFLNSFDIIYEDIREKKEELEKNFSEFGPEGYPYKEVALTHYKSLKFLHSAHNILSRKDAAKKSIVLDDMRKASYTTHSEARKYFRDRADDVDAKLVREGIIPRKERSTRYK